MKTRKIIALALSICMIFSSLIVVNANSTKYWLKVNTKCNVVNVYKMQDGKWKPFKVMVCSCGLGTNRDNTTPKGTYKLKYKWRWLSLVANQYGQYCSQITGDYLFHSVPYSKYGKHSTQFTKQFNKLGKKASHGCVRLSVMDARWIYNNCKKGTKITVYSSSKAGPLGKPATIKVSTKKKLGWDPTDPAKGNPNYKLPGPKISLNSGKSIELEIGSKAKLLSFVKAIDPNTFRDLTGSIKVVSNNVKRNVPGTYTVKYKVSNKYCGTAYKSFKVTVIDPNPAPGPENPEPENPV